MHRNAPGRVIAKVEVDVPAEMFKRLTIYRSPMQFRR